ncbi:hypothetical protein [Actinocorallia populi]|uniref:hypothetical protein n=1 Tax=Actinocorallia populi TaxID=2079200 RepID=UPI000D087E7D|nr:hypothetical protein [Actinocorallia populi]
MTTKRPVDSTVLHCVFHRVDPESEWKFLRLDHVAARLADLAEFCSIVDALGRMDGDAQSGVRPRRYRDLEQEYAEQVVAAQPAVLSMSLSPRLFVEVITRSGSQAARLLTRPEDVEKWSLEVGASWHRAQNEAEKAVQAHRRLLADGMTVEPSTD